MTNETERARAFYEQAYDYDHPINYGGDEDSFEERNRPLRGVLSKWMVHLHVPDEATVVEVGCGMGYLHVCHPNWHGIEYSSIAVKRAKENLGNRLNIEQGDARCLPLESGSIDFLFSFAALEHIPEVERAFQEIGRVLRPGGGGVNQSCVELPALDGKKVANKALFRSVAIRNDRKTANSIEK